MVSFNFVTIKYPLIMVEDNISNEILERKDEPNTDKHALPSADHKSSPQLSKRQLKRLKKQEKWLSMLPAKRLKEKNKLKLRKQEAKEKNIKLGPTRKELKSSKMSTSNCKIKVALDFSFDHLMSPKDISKCINQVLRCYSYNRRSPDPMQFYVVNFNGHAKEEMAKHNGYQHWDVHFHSESYLDLFKKESIVYLTSDSDNVIQSLEQEKVYIIGALVDHNSHKGLCHRIAVEQGLAHGRLPLSEHLEMKSRKILAINHVFEILLNVCKGLPWKDAFLKVLPQRKGAFEKHSVSNKTVQTLSQEKNSTVNSIHKDNNIGSQS